MEIAEAKEHIYPNPGAQSLQKPASGAAHEPRVNFSYFFPRHEELFSMQMQLISNPILRKFLGTHALYCIEAHNGKIFLWEGIVQKICSHW